MKDYEVVRYEPRKIKITKHPIFIVGMNPAKPTQRSSNCHVKLEVWTGSRGATLVNKAIKGKRNLYLTNVFNWYIGHLPSDMYALDGIGELERDVVLHEPVKIICLGSFAYDVVLQIASRLELKIPIVIHQHPSYIYRFNKNKEKYVHDLRKEMP